MFHKYNILAILVLFLLTFSACGEDENVTSAEQKVKDENSIQQYLSDNGLTSTKTASGLHYIVVSEGIGTAHPLPSSNVEVKYKGSLLNKKVFDQSPENKTITFGLGQVIKGWQEGLQLMKKDEKAILIIPSYLGYGAQSLSGIPANSVLVFDIELIGFN